MNLLKKKKKKKKNQKKRNKNQTEQMAEGTEFAEAKMVTEMNTKEQRAAFKSVSAAHRAKLGHCTRKMNEIKTIMKEDAGVDYIHGGVSEFQRILDEFKMCHESVQKLLADDVRENEILDWYEPKMANYTTFLIEVEKWLKSQLDPQTLVDATDSVSKVSMTSSKASFISSARMKAAADEAALLARAEALKRKHELELEKLQLSAKIESLEMETLLQLMQN